MIYTGYTKTDTYYEFVGSEGKLIMPTTDVILVDDESGMLAIKNTASRCTVGLLKIAPPAPSYKFTATYTGGTTYSVECDSSTELTSATTKPEDYEFTAMTSAIIGDCVTSIGTSAFNGCKSLTSIVIPSGVTSIGERTFYNCSGLTSIDIPDSVTTINDYTFQGCSSLTSCTIGSGVTSITQGAFQNCSGLTSIDIPESVTIIGGAVFYNCTGLTSIDIPDSVKWIGNSAFQKCYSLSSIDIPDSVTSIAGSAFRDCSGLTAITVNATTPPTLPNANAFSNTNDCQIYVPASSVETYKSTSGWSTYASRITAIPNS